MKPSTAETSINNFFKDKAKPRKAVPTGRETDFTRFLKSTAVRAIGPPPPAAACHAIK